MFELRECEFALQAWAASVCLSESVCCVMCGCVLQVEREFVWVVSVCLCERVCFVRCECVLQVEFDLELKT